MSRSSIRDLIDRSSLGPILHGPCVAGQDHIPDTAGVGYCVRCEKPIRNGRPHRPARRVSVPAGLENRPSYYCVACEGTLASCECETIL